MFRVALIHPSIPDVNTIVPPLGILYIAAYLEKNGFEVFCYDEDPLHFNFSNVFKAIHPDLIGISLSTMNFERARSLISQIRLVVPNTPICCGGIHTSALPVETMQELNVDFCVIGEGEETFLELCHKLSTGEAIFNEILGLVFKENGEIIRNPPRPLIQNLDDLPFPARHLLPFNRYISPPGFIRGLFFNSTMDLMASRGCPAQCAYCGSKIIFGCRIRFRSPENVIKELWELQKQYNFETFCLIDDNVASNAIWVEQFCDLLIKHRNQKPWFFLARVGSINGPLLQKLKQSHCIQIEFGIESGSLRVLKRMKKGITPVQAIATFDLIKHYHIRRLATFMVGYDGETLEDTYQTFTLARRLNADYTGFFFAIPFPGTEFFDAVKDKIQLDYSENWSIRQNTKPFPVSRMSPETLSKIRAKFQNHFFFRNFVRLQNLIFIMRICIKVLYYPPLFISAIRQLVAKKDIEKFAEIMINFYRLKFHQN